MPFDKSIIDAATKYLNKESTQKSPESFSEPAPQKNYEKLTPVEKQIYGALPKVASSGFGKILDTFSKTVVGKALSYVDVFAEGVERTVGTGLQLATKSPEEKINLRDAWYAGSLTYDVANLPETIQKTQKNYNILSGKWEDAPGPISGFVIPTDLPGMQGLADARLKIGQYVSQGMTAGDALAKVKDEYMNGLGALAIRSQIQDTFFHIVADPANYLIPALKPVERLQATKIWALSNKASKTVEELNSMAKVAKTSEEAAQLTELANKVASGTVARMNSWDKFATFITGGSPFEEASKAQQVAEKVIGKIPIVGKPLVNALKLTPESKAQELLTLLNDNINTKIVARLYNEPDAEAKIVAAIERASTGATTDFGYAFLTQEGRTAQAFMSGANGTAQTIYDNYKALEGQRGTLNLLADVLKIDPGEIIANGEKNSGNLFRTLAKEAPIEIQQAIQRGEITQETFSDLAKIFKDMPYNKDTFIIHVMAGVEDRAMQQAIVQFGVQSRGLLTRWSNAIKSAESLAFMRLNPAYGIRNVVNNDFTMISRGVFGTMSKAEIAAFWKDAGFVPKRLSEGFHIGTKVDELAGKQLEKVLSGGKHGLPEGVQDFFGGIKLGKYDVSALSRDAESAASAQAFTQGYQQGIRMFSGKTPVAASVLGADTVDAIEKLKPGLLDSLRDTSRSALGSEVRFNKALEENLNIVSQTILDRASKISGTDVSKILDAGTLTYITEGLPDAIKTGKVDQFIESVKLKIDNHVEEMFQQNVDNLVGNIKNQTAVGGYPAILDKTSEAQDLYWQAHIQHTQKVQEAAEAARLAASKGDFKAADALWRANFADDQKFFNRLSRRVQGYLDGMEQGAKEAGIKFPPEVKQAFRDSRKEWEGFFKERQSEYEKFFAARLEGKEYTKTWDSLQTYFDAKYTEVASAEDRLMHQADEAISLNISDPVQRQVFMNYRDTMAQLNKTRKEAVVSFRQSLTGVPKEELQQRWAEFWHEQAQFYQQAKDTDHFGKAAMQGDKNAIGMFSQSPRPETIALQKEYDSLVKQLEKDALNMTPEKKAALQPVMDRMAEIDNILRPVAPEGASQKPFIADYKQIVPDLQPVDLGVDQTAYTHYGNAIDAIKSATKEQMGKGALSLSDLPVELRGKVDAYLSALADQRGSERLAATRFAEYRRDSALLNYNRRTNFDSWTGNVMPFAFWTTSSMVKWAVESIDRPAMFTSYLRIKKFLETAGAPENGFPSRFKDQIKVQLPFAPAWMGDQYVDPLRLALPFDSFLQPLDQWQTAQLTTEGRAQRLLDSQLQDGTITQFEHDSAIQSKSGSVWENAVSQAQENDDSLKFDAWDFASLVSSPHAPLVWAYNALSGHPEDISPFTPESRMMKNAATMLGVPDWNNSSWNLEGKVRKMLGLPAFDKWDDYRTDRALSDMAADGTHSVDDVQRAMALSAAIQNGLSLEKAQQDPVYPVYLDGVQRGNQEYAGGATGFLGGLIGLPVHSYPEGEKAQRILQAEFSAAYDTRNKANDKIQQYLDAHPNVDPKQALLDYEKKNPSIAKDASALTDFFDKHPEYESRLALFKKPEERLNQFLTDQVWSRWHELPNLTKNELKDQLGTPFSDAIENKNFSAATSGQMAVWLKLIGGKPVGTLSSDQQMLTDYESGQLKLTKPETAWRTQVFYDTRTNQYPDWFSEQSAYYDPKLKKSMTPAQVRDLKGYWNWRRDFMTKNPDIVPYITDDQKAIAKAKTAKRKPEAVPMAKEIQLSPAMNKLVEDARNGNPLPASGEKYLEVTAFQYNMSVETLKGILGIP